MLKKQISPKIISLIFGILVICFVIGFYIFAWTEPASFPPSGNVAAPLNTSTSPQTKQGAITLWDRLTATGFIDFDNSGYFIDPYPGDNPLLQSVKVKGYIQAEGGYKSSDGSSGLGTASSPKIIQVMQSGYGLCTMTFKNGLLTATTCPQ